ncbi:hypothetical protein KIN20_003040 [Parelaphostrongylus tenuis]|uniref:Uncharacterized protein n=1 Tax=Parelaphostrongylus tenuis TaxID=148309 RepID=A0AAD5QH58_PARTN|nr:hypothetical protein KIN20_003040 [Parelaphostrongylus tenuis]
MNQTKLQHTSQLGSNEEEKGGHMRKSTTATTTTTTTKEISHSSLRLDYPNDNAQETNAHGRADKTEKNVKGRTERRALIGMEHRGTKSQ